MRFVSSLVQSRQQSVGRQGNINHLRSSISVCRITQQCLHVHVALVIRSSTSKMQLRAKNPSMNHHHYTLAILIIAIQAVRR